MGDSMLDLTTEFSFILKPSSHGVGVFAVHGIRAGTYLRLFGDSQKTVSLRNADDVPELFREFCVDLGGALCSPSDFGCMAIGWYLNHSTTPNAQQTNYVYFASRDISTGEEITIDYSTLKEPAEGPREDS
jgi:SET domain-containing protein